MLSPSFISVLTVPDGPTVGPADWSSIELFLYRSMATRKTSSVTNGYSFPPSLSLTNGKITSIYPITTNLSLGGPFFPPASFFRRR